MKLCSDCKYFRLHVRYYQHQLGIGRDVSPEKSTCKLTDMVTGSGESGNLCSWERENGECGPSAINFEPSPPKLDVPEMTERRSWLKRVFG